MENPPFMEGLFCLNARFSTVVSSGLDRMLEKKLKQILSTKNTLERTALTPQLVETDLNLKL